MNNMKSSSNLFAVVVTRSQNSTKTGLKSQGKTSPKSSNSSFISSSSSSSKNPTSQAQQINVLFILI
jgi:hypothetical protein